MRRYLRLRRNLSQGLQNLRLRLRPKLRILHFKLFALVTTHPEQRLLHFKLFALVHQKLRLRLHPFFIALRLGLT